MNYTTNNHLPQWVETDRIMMEDFNQMCAAIDQGIKTAQSTADTAESKADAAQTTASAAQTTAGAAYCPSNKPYVFGSYEGTSHNQHIVLGFRPSAVLIYECYSGDSAEEAAGGCSLHCDDEISSNVSPEDEGFHLRIDYGGYPYTNRNGYTYVYMAFR